MEPKVSVIIPVYNAEKYLRQCLDSVINQSLREIEIICVDDGSIDGSTDILLEYAAKDERIRVIAQKNGGPGKARNYALTVAAGEYIIFLDADDWFEWNMLSAMIDTAIRNEADITICKAERFDDLTGKVLDSAWMLKEQYLPGEAFAPEEIAGHLFQFTYGQVWDKLYSARFLKKTGITFPDLRCAEDTAFAYKTLLAAGRIAILPEVKVHYRVNVTGSVSNSFVKYPKAPFKSFEIVHEFIKEKGLYTQYERSFLNWAMEYLTWQICSMPDERIRKEYYMSLKDELFQRLKFDKKPILFFKLKNYFRYLLVTKLPYMAFALILKTYKLYVR